MSVNEIIQQAMKDIVKEVWPMVCPRAKPPTEYIVYNPEIDVPEDFGDDKTNAWVQHMQIHYFIRYNIDAGCNGDYTENRKKIRKALSVAGFTITDITTLYEKDSGYNHLCFSCSIEEDLEEE